MSKKYSSEHLFVKTFSLGTYLQGGVGHQHVILAHGAGAGMHHEFMQRQAEALISQGFKVSLFEYAYMQTITATGKRRPPTRVSELMLEHYQWINFLAQDDYVWLMGKSMGGRLSSLLAQDVLPSQVQGWCALGYPFHPVKKPHQLRVEHLMGNRLPGLIIQGSRDALGNQQEVELYQLPNSIKLHWLSHMDHSFKPYKQAPLTLQQAIKQSAIWFKQWSQAQI